LIKPRLACAVAALTLAAHVQAQPAPAGRTAPLRSVEVIAALELPRVEVNGLRTSELSALAWSPASKTLFAASDKGRLFAYALRWEGGRVVAAQPMAGTALLAPDVKTRLNAEGLVFAAAGGGQAARLIVAPELGASAWAYAASSPALMPPTPPTPTPLPWPKAIAQAVSDAGAKHGVEAVEWHPLHGLMAALQRPTAAEPGHHVVHAADGTRWAFATAAARADVKAIERIGESRLLILERVRGGASGQRQFVLREIDLRDCTGAACNPPVIALSGAALDGRDNFEGLACVDETTCLLVSDDGSDGAGPTRLVQITLVR
jgi:Esterase-like activity of phytase